MALAVIVAAVVLPVATRVGVLSPRVHMVSFTPAHCRMRVLRNATADGDFERMLSSARPSIAFNGTYYGTDGLPLGLLRSQGNWVFRGGRMRTAFVVDGQGHPAVIARDAVRRAPEEYPFAVAAGPRLLRAGQLDLNPEAEGFRPASRLVRASRVALGVRRDGRAAVVVDEDDVTLGEFAVVCRSAGLVDAVNLDGGGATALYHNGRIEVTPRIPMADVITVSPR